jgi:hypothetical protein
MRSERAVRGIAAPPAMLRAAPARAAPGRVDRPTRVIRDAAVVTRGEAIGHDLWLDAEFIAQVATAINASRAGIKARFTHPSLSSDGLGKFLGRVRDARLEGGVVRADLHLAEIASQSPDGDLAGYVMDLAEEDPAAFGVSVVFTRDEDAERRFAAAHQGDDGRFQSPDGDNTQHLPHARLARLWAADVVDDPAANPGGIFHRGDELAAEAERLAAYALGISDEHPGVTTFGIDADRVRQFAARFLAHHGLALTEVAAMCTTTDTPKAADVPSPAPVEPMTAQQIEQRWPDAARELRGAGQQAELNRFAALQKRFAADPGFVVAAFADGQTVEQADAQWKDHEIARLTQRVEELEAPRAVAGEAPRAARPVAFAAPGDAPGDFLDAARQLRAERQSSLTEAMRIVAREKPDLHRAWLARQ